MSGFILSSYWAMLSYLHTSKKITSPSRDVVHMHLQPFKHMQLHLKNKQKHNKQPISTAPSGKKKIKAIFMNASPFLCSYLLARKLILAAQGRSQVCPR